MQDFLFWLGCFLFFVYALLIYVCWKFNEQAKIATEKIEKEGQKWLATIIVILLGAMIILVGSDIYRRLRIRNAKPAAADDVDDLDLVAVSHGMGGVLSWRHQHAVDRYGDVVVGKVAGGEHVADCHALMPGDVPAVVHSNHGDS